MGALVCSSPLLPLPRPLLFVINACNECVTHPRVVILSNDGYINFSTHQPPPIRAFVIWDKIRTQFLVTSPSLFDAFIVSWCFIYHVICLRLRWLRCVSVFQFSCARSSIWSMLFPLFFYCCIIFCGCLISLEHSSSSPIFLLFLLSPFLNLPSFLHLFMVDFSLVRTSCPSISFFLSCLCGLLKSVGRKRLGVGLFVGRDCPYRFVLLFLIPLVYHLAGVA